MTNSNKLAQISRRKTTNSIWEKPKQTCLFENIYEHLPKSKKTLLLRAIFSVILIAYFCLTVYLGPFAIIFTTLAIQMKCFFELIDIAYSTCQTPSFRLISWYFLVAANYFFYGENIMEYFGVFVDKFEYLKVLIVYHRFLSFVIYLVGFIWFVMTLKKKYDRRQFALLSWTHFALLVIVSQSYMVIKNVFQGLIWVTVCVTSVACNDIMAYLCGKFFGKTPLIEVSPKKTWEGFIGGAIFTIIYGFIISSALCPYQYFVCPIEYQETSSGIVMLTECERSSIFSPKSYIFSTNFCDILKASITLRTYPFVLHTFWLSLFSSVMAPFGGFFASGFKRAFKVKDFGDIIPGHGGILDRFDCQIFMTTFVNVYITTFVKTSSVERIFSRILSMKTEDQLSFFYTYEDLLINKGFNVSSY